MRTKFRTLTVTLMTALCMTLFCVPAFAMSEEPAQSTTLSAETTAPVETTTPADAETGTSSNPFTPSGTGTVVDNATDEDGKEFYTIKTADENVFYLVIDKQRSTENVYFLNAVTESDLMALAEKDGSTTTAPVEPEPTPEPEEPADEPAQPEQPAKTGISTGMMLLIGIVVLAVGGAGYYVKIYKPKHELDDAEDWDDISFAGPEEEPVEDDFPEPTDEEEAERRRQYEEDADEDDEMDGDGDAPVQ